MTEYPEGVPCWVDLSSPDPDASARFYGELFGWQTREIEPAYRIFTLDGANVAGLGRARDGRLPAWNTYVAVADAAAAKERVEAAGGATLVDPVPMHDAGTSAIFADAAEGAAFAVWQADRHGGAELMNAPGALTMNELATRDVDAAARFYGAVFGWEFEPLVIEGSMQYGFFKLGGRTMAGVLPMGETFPPGVPSYWVPYFGIDDLDAGAERARSLGAAVIAGPTPVPNGRFVALRDPQGAVFSIWEGSYDPPAVSGGS